MIKFILAVARNLVVVSNLGQLLAYEPITGASVSPPVIGDFDNDGQDDVIITTDKG
jgi:hypothetical protein